MYKIIDRINEMKNDKIFKSLSKKLDKDTMYKIVFMVDTAMVALEESLKCKDLNSSILDLFSEKFLTAFLLAWEKIYIKNSSEGEC